MGTELLLYPFVGGELAQALGNLPEVFDHKKPQEAIFLAEHEVLCLPYLLRGGSEGGDDVGKAGSCEFPDDAIEMAKAVAEGGHLYHVGVDLIVPRRHFLGWG